MIHNRKIAFIVMLDVCEIVFMQITTKYPTETSLSKKPAIAMETNTKKIHADITNTNHNQTDARH